VAFFATAYMISPHYCHRFVGYLEEEAVITYTKCLQVHALFTYSLYPQFVLSRLLRHMCYK